MEWHVSQIFPQYGPNFPLRTTRESNGFAFKVMQNLFRNDEIENN